MAKTHSAFCSPELRAAVRHNIAQYGWAAAARDQLVAAAAPWRAKSDDELWGLMFGPKIRRAWHVWSNGDCPACGRAVPMYEWRMDALEQPWKTKCPRCGELFPKNDFAAFYQSGLDAHGVFDPARADRSLLFNVDHPDPQDPRHQFGVDDGTGYRLPGAAPDPRFLEGQPCWRFIGAYLIYGQWKQAIVQGVRCLSLAYTVTDDASYAHQALVMLDRVADLFPSFDFGEQGVMYEGRAHSGAVSTWHDACEEIRELALAYDRVFPALAGDAALVRFLDAKARQYQLPRPKATAADIQANIEDGLFRDTLAHPQRIHSNFPRQPIALLVIKAVLDWPENRAAITQELDPMLAEATAVDGVTGEKSPAGYAAFVIEGLASFLGELERLDRDFLGDLFRRQPALRRTWRFFVDTRCLGRYYPQVGDMGYFAGTSPRYAGVICAPGEHLDPSMYTFLWRLFELTGDPAYVQALYEANGHQLAGLPHDLTAADPQAFQEQVRAVIARHGQEPVLDSVHLANWHLAILRSGQAADARAAWLSYDSNGRHSHRNGLNLGLFARGLDLLPDFGYPPVQYGGWDAPRSRWYMRALAHNLVIVDGQDQQWAVGRCTLWATGRQLRVMRASGPELIAGQQYERTVALVDTPSGGFYLVDVFRVIGGREHAKFVHSHFGTVVTDGLNLTPAPTLYDDGSLMRNFRRDAAPAPGWSATWQVEDRYRLLPPGVSVGLRCTELTRDAEAWLGEAWINTGSEYSGTTEAWIPRLAVRRQAAAPPLASTFVAVIEAFGAAPEVLTVRRLPLADGAGQTLGEAHVAVEVTLRDGHRDLLLAADVENPLGQPPGWPPGASLVQPEWQVQTDAELGWVRRSPDGRVQAVAWAQGSHVSVGAERRAAAARVPFAEYP